MKLPATVTLPQASAVMRMVEAEIASSGGALQIDASALQAFDSSALAVLLAARRLALSHGGTLQLSGTPQKLAQLAALYGVDGLLSLSVPRAAPST